MSRRPALLALSRRAGILDGYHAAGSGEWRETSDATRAALLAVMGYEADSEASARGCLAALRRREDMRTLSECAVETLGEPRASRLELGPGVAGDAIRWHLDLELESGERRTAEGSTRTTRSRGTWLPLPGAPLPAGVHQIRLEITRQGRSWRAGQLRIVSPARCTQVAECLQPEGHAASAAAGFGLQANLYSIRSERNWGVGDLSDLATLMQLAAEVGAAFVAVNPLHALRNSEDEISPYSPLSRLFRNPIYLDATAVPELAACPEARECISRLEPELARLRAGLHVDYPAVARAKDRVLRILYRTYRGREAGPGEARARDYATFCRREDPVLTDFATFLALCEQRSRAGESVDWRRWPEALRDPRSAAVARFRAEHADAVDYRRYLQFEVDRQLDEAGRSGSLPLGVCGDLAVGSRPDGADPWLFPRAFARGATLGAPPDEFAPRGQDWQLAPLDPRALRQDGYALWRRVLRSAFAHCGALRIDHVMGLCRAFWIPEGLTPDRGAYVRMPEADLLRILSLESRRAHAVAVGEDLGTVPAGLASRLARRGILSTRVLYFERGRRGFRASSRYPARCLALADNHDLAPLAGWWSETDLVLRKRSGVLSGEALERAQHGRACDRDALWARLRREGLVAPAEPGPPPGPELADPSTLIAAVARYLCRTPAALVGLSLDDLAAEREPVNLPGVPPSQYRSWSRKMRLTLEAVGRGEQARAVLAAVPAARRQPGRAAADP